MKFGLPNQSRLRDLLFSLIYASILSMLATKKKSKVIKNHQIHDKDTGSSQVQIGILTARIDELAGHLKKHKKDNHSRRGLIKMVANRRNHLKYLERTNKEAHADVVKKMNLA